MSQAAPTSGRRGFPWLLTLLTLVSLAILLALGTWQVQRLFWKEALIETIDGRVGSPPRPLATVEAGRTSGDDIEYTPVSLSGTFLHDREQYFFATHEGQSGWFVYTPLALGDGRFVFVNRGFVPFDRRDPASRPEGQVATPVEMAGLARAAPAEKPSWIVPDNKPQDRTYYWKDLAAMIQVAGLDPSKVVPFFVDADATPNPGGLPVGAVTIIDLPNSHLQYAVTWYGLAAALLAVYGTMLLRWRREGGSRP